MPANDTLATPAARGPEVRRSTISGFRFQLSAFLISALKSLTSVLRPLSSVLPLALFSVLWIDLIRQLSYQWSTNEQYAYGWFLPFLALGLLLKKWPDRPVPSPISAFSFPWPVKSSLARGTDSVFHRAAYFTGLLSAFKSLSSVL